MTYTRQDAIEYLVQRDESDIQQMINQDDWTYLDTILRTGFVGYSSLNNSELEEEIGSSSSDEEEITVLDE